MTWRYFRSAVKSFPTFDRLSRHTRGLYEMSRLQTACSPFGLRMVACRGDKHDSRR